jgi:hypothetical protein
MARLGKHAIVIGASMGGLLAARACAACLEKNAEINVDRDRGWGSRADRAAARVAGR